MLNEIDLVQKALCPGVAIKKKTRNEMKTINRSVYFKAICYLLDIKKDLP